MALEVLSWGTYSNGRKHRTIQRGNNVLRQERRFHFHTTWDEFCRRFWVWMVMYPLFCCSPISYLVINENAFEVSRKPYLGWGIWIFLCAPCWIAFLWYLLPYSLDRLPIYKTVEVKTLAQYQAEIAKVEQAKKQAHLEANRLEANRKSLLLQEQRAREQAIRSAQMERDRKQKEAQNRVASCRFDNWISNPNEPYLKALPQEWAPIAMAGMAYVDIVSKGSEPGQQRMNPSGLGYVRTTPQEPNYRGLFLITTQAQRTINKALVLEPTELPFTSNQNLVIFAMTRDEQILFIYNPARKETYAASMSEEAEQKVSKLLPVLLSMYEKHVHGSNDKGTWA